MELLVSILIELGYILIFPGFLFCMIAGLLIAGIDRKLIARMQKRVGPPILQPVYDFFKLCGKETIIPAAANKTAFLLCPIIGLAALVVLQLFIPIHGFEVFTAHGDVIVILYLLLIPAIAEIAGASASGSPYAGIGLSREMVTVISCELPLVLIILAVGRAISPTGDVTFSLSAINLFQTLNGSLILKPALIPAAIAFLMVIPGEIGAHPFDAAEAETEICEGMLAEYSGAPLAVYKLTHAIKMYTMASIFVALFLGGIGTGNLALNIIINFALCLAVIIVSSTVLNAITARLKINQTFKYYWTAVSGLAFISLVLVWLGL